MIYTFNIPTLVKRYLAPELRMPRILALGRVLLSWLRVIHLQFLAWRTDEVLAQYRFNGLIHSLEWMLNDRFDAIERRIYITVVDQVPTYYHLSQGDPPAVAYSTEGMMTGYYHLDQDAVTDPYLYEFLVHVPADVVFNTTVMFALLDLYRYAGRRPAIRQFGPGDSTVSITLYPGITPPANSPVVAIPDLPTE